MTGLTTWAIEVPAPRIELAAKNSLSIDVVRHVGRHRSLAMLMVYRDELENRQKDLAVWLSERLPE